MPNTANRAREILDALATRYAAMRSYQDQGFVRSDGTPGRTDVEFRTFYSAPTLARFEFTTSHPYPPLSHIKFHDIVGSDGKTAYFWQQHHNEPPELETNKDLSLAIAGATGISRGAAHTIFRLLLPGIGGFSIQELRNLGLLNDLDLDGTPCHQLVGHHPDGTRYTLTIERDALLLRQCSCQDPSYPHEEVRHHIQVDQAIPADTFRLPAIS